MRNLRSRSNNLVTIVQTARVEHDNTVCNGKQAKNKYVIVANMCLVSCSLLGRRNIRDVGCGDRGGSAASAAGQLRHEQEVVARRQADERRGDATSRHGDEEDGPPSDPRKAPKGQLHCV